MTRFFAPAALLVCCLFHVVGCSADTSTDSSSDGGAGGEGVDEGAGGSGAQNVGAGGEGGEGTSYGGFGTGGEGGGGSQCTPERVFDGAPVEGEAGVWTWVDVPESSCRDGSPTGFGVRINPESDKLVIYFEGGGACFTGMTCVFNLASYDGADFAQWGGDFGIFDSENPDNPLRDWNAVYIPYCTGDLHSGTVEDGDVYGALSPKGQAFVGYRNVGHFLNRLVPTFPDVTKVLVAGSSAGGFGATFNFDRISQAFCPDQSYLINDSAPAMGDDWASPCLQARWREVWGLDSVLAASCPECSAEDGGGLVNYNTYLANRYPESRLGLLSTERDQTIRIYFGLGQNGCANLDGLVPFPMSEQTYAEGLLDLRESYLSPSPAWTTYFVPGTSHTFLVSSAYYSTTVGDVPLTDWVAAMVEDGEPGHVGP